MYTCGTCERPVTFDHFGEPHCLCTEKTAQKALRPVLRLSRAFWIGTVISLGIAAILWGLLLWSLHTHFVLLDKGSYCAHVDRANRGNCE